jgi:hypothetical protein
MGLMLVAAVSYFVVPMFQLTHPYRIWFARGFGPLLLLVGADLVRALAAAMTCAWRRLRACRWPWFARPSAHDPVAAISPGGARSTMPHRSIFAWR